MEKPEYKLGSELLKEYPSKRLGTKDYDSTITERNKYILYCVLPRFQFLEGINEEEWKRHMEIYKKFQEQFDIYTELINDNYQVTEKEIEERNEKYREEFRKDRYNCLDREAKTEWSEKVCKYNSYEYTKIIDAFDNLDEKAADEYIKLMNLKQKYLFHK